MNTLENKAKFFAQYWGQRVLLNKLTGNAKSIVCQFSFPSLPIDENKKWNSYLELKPLSSISDEDCITVSLFFNKKENKWIDDLTQKESDYLRSKGYALDWNGITVEQQLEYVWIKLKENE